MKPGPRGNVIRILLVERMNLLRGALAALLSDEDDLVVPAAIAEVGEVLPSVHKVEPDVVIIDVDQLDGYGLAEVQELTTVLPDCSVLVLAAPGSASAVRAALDSHVRGFVSKDVVPSHLADSVRRVAMGERVIDPTLAVAALRVPRNPLTARECQILEFVARGAPSAEIADRLYLAKGTVANYVSTIIRKIGARNRLEAVRIAADSGWLSAPGGHAPIRSR